MWLMPMLMVWLMEIVSLIVLCYQRQGLPNQKRMKGRRELGKQKKTCGLCKHVGYNISTCSKKETCTSSNGSKKRKMCTSSEMGLNPIFCLKCYVEALGVFLNWYWIQYFVIFDNLMPLLLPPLWLCYAIVNWCYSCLFVCLFFFFSFLGVIFSFWEYYSIVLKCFG